MTKTELVNKLEEYNDSYEDIFNSALHKLSEEDSNKLTVKQFLEILLKENLGEFK